MHNCGFQKTESQAALRTARDALPDNKGKLQAQGWTGPLSTGTGGAPAKATYGDLVDLRPCDLQP
jgi:hypothetical protein